MKVQLQLILTLATLVLLASGCARSQVEPSILSALSPTALQANAQAIEAAGTSNEPENPLIPAQMGNEATSTRSVLAQSTGTPVSMSTPTPKSTATRSHQPSPVSDLLYIAQGRLMRWDPLTNHAISLAQNVIDFTASADGQVIVLVRPQKITANGAQQFNLDALLLKDQQIFTLVGNASQIKQIIVSPDGRQVAFTQDLAEGVSIFILPIAPESEPQKLGVCQPVPTGKCASLVWSPDGRDLLWSDTLGLWQAPANAGEIGQKAQLVHPNMVQVVDPKGKSMEIEARFTELQFAPSERFVLLKVTPLASQVGWHAVFDRRSGQLAQAPDTFVTSESEAEAIWGSNGNLLVVHASEPGRHLPPFLHIWHVMPTNPELLVSGQQFDLYSNDFPFSTAQSKSIPAHCLHWLAEIQPNHIVFAVQLNPSDDPPVLFDLNLLRGSLTKLYELPTDTTQVLWSPDGVNALVLGGRNRLSFLSLKTGEFSDLLPIFGSDAHQFVWMPPVLRR